MKRIHEVVLEIAMVLVLGLAAVLAAPRAHGEMITTDVLQAGDGHHRPAGAHHHLAARRLAAVA